MRVMGAVKVTPSPPNPLVIFMLQQGNNQQSNPYMLIITIFLIIGLYMIFQIGYHYLYSSPKPKPTTIFIISDKNTSSNTIIYNKSTPSNTITLSSNTSRNTTIIKPINTSNTITSSNAITKTLNTTIPSNTIAKRSAASNATMQPNIIADPTTAFLIPMGFKPFSFNYISIETNNQSEINYICKYMLNAYQDPQYIGGRIGSGIQPYTFSGQMELAHLGEQIYNSTGGTPDWVTGYCN